MISKNVNLYTLVRSLFLNHKNLLGPILFRFAFFALNLFFIVRITSLAGWNFFAILLLIFATRDFVHAIRLAQVYYHLKKETDNKKNDK